MPLEERKDRWNVMMAALRANNIHDWTARFLQELGTTKPKAWNSTGRWAEPAFQRPQS
jgi:trehalose-6-phosphate synthase